MQFNYNIKRTFKDCLNVDIFDLICNVKVKVIILAFTWNEEAVQNWNAHFFWGILILKMSLNTLWIIFIFNFWKNSNSKAAFNYDFLKLFFFNILQIVQFLFSLPEQMS